MGCFVFLIVPGIGLLYGGMARRKSALAMIFQGLTVMAVISFQWQFWGFTLAFSRDGGPFIGTMSNFGLIDTLVAPSWYVLNPYTTISRSTDLLESAGELPSSLTSSSHSTN